MPHHGIFGIRTWNFFFRMHDIGEFLWNTIPYALWIANYILTSTRNHKRKCETNRSSAYHITPKRGNVGNPSSRFSYQHLTPDGVIIKATTSFQILGDRKGPHLRAISIPQMDFPTIMNYELCIMNYPGDHKGPPLRQIQSLRCISQQLWIMNYEL